MTYGFRRTGVLAACVLAALLVSATPAAAQLSWDPSTIGTLGGDGTWDDGTTSNWWNGASSVVWSGGNLATFAGAQGSNNVAVSGTITSATGLNFTGTGALYNLSGGTITLTGTGTLGGTQNATIGSVLDGAVGVTKTGLNIITLTGANIYTGGTAVNQGVLVVSGAGGTIGAGGISLGGGTLTVDNTTNNLVDRLFGNGLTSNGGTFNFNHAGAAATNYGESSLGILTLNPGALNFNTSQADVGQTSILQFDSYTRNAGGTVRFSGTGLGVDDRNAIKFATAPTLSNGILPGAVVNNAGTINLVTHSTVNGDPITAFAGYQASSDANTDWTAATVNARPAATVPVNNLTGNKTLNSLVLDNGINVSGGTADRTIAIGANGIGMVVQTGGSSSILRNGNNENVLAFGANEAVFHVEGVLVHERNGTNVLTGSGGLTKSGAGTLQLGTDGSPDYRHALGGVARYNEGTVEIFTNDNTGLSSFSGHEFNGGNLTVHITGGRTWGDPVTVNANATITNDRRPGNQGAGVAQSFSTLAVNNNGALTLNTGSNVTSGRGATNFTSTGSLGSGSSLNLGANSSSQFGGAFSAGAGSFINVGANSLLDFNAAGSTVGGNVSIASTGELEVRSVTFDSSSRINNSGRLDGGEGASNNVFIQGDYFGAAGNSVAVRNTAGSLTGVVAATEFRFDNGDTVDTGTGRNVIGSLFYENGTGNFTVAGGTEVLLQNILQYNPSNGQPWIVVRDGSKFTFADGYDVRYPNSNSNNRATRLGGNGTSSVVEFRGNVGEFLGSRDAQGQVGLLTLRTYKGVNVFESTNDQAPAGTSTGSGFNFQSNGAVWELRNDGSNTQTYSNGSIATNAGIDITVDVQTGLAAKFETTNFTIAANSTVTKGAGQGSLNFNTTRLVMAGTNRQLNLLDGNILNATIPAGNVLSANWGTVTNAPANGVNGIVMAAGSIVGHNNDSTATMAGLGATPNYFLGLGTDFTHSDTVGTGTAWTGISTDIRANRSWTAGTITLGGGTVTLQGINGRTLTIGGTAAFGGAAAGTDLFISGNVVFDVNNLDLAAVDDITVQGGTLTLNQPFQNLAGDLTLFYGNLNAQGAVDAPTTLGDGVVNYRGFDTLSVTKGGTTGTIDFTVAGLNRVNRGAMNIAAAELGTNEKLFVTGQAATPLLPTNLVNGNNFVAYDATNGVVSAIHTATTVDAAAVTDIVDVTANDVMTANKQIRALRIGAFTLDTAGNTLTLGDATPGTAGIIATAPSSIIGGSIDLGNRELTTQVAGDLLVSGGSTTNASTTVTVSSTADVRAGMRISGTNIPAGSTVVSVLSPTQVQISSPATGNAGSLTFDFDSILNVGSSILNGSSGLTKFGAGILNLNGDNSGLNNQVTVSQGTLSLASAPAAGTNFRLGPATTLGLRADVNTAFGAFEIDDVPNSTVNVNLAPATAGSDVTLAFTGSTNIAAGNTVNLNVTDSYNLGVNNLTLNAGSTINIISTATGGGLIVAGTYSDTSTSTVQTQRFTGGRHSGLVFTNPGNATVDANITTNGDSGVMALRAIERDVTFTGVMAHANSGKVLAAYDGGSVLVDATAEIQTFNGANWRTLSIEGNGMTVAGAGAAVSIAAGYNTATQGQIGDINVGNLAIFESRNSTNFNQPPQDVSFPGLTVNGKWRVTSNDQQYVGTVTANNIGDGNVTASNSSIETVSNLSLTGNLNTAAAKRLEKQGAGNLNVNGTATYGNNAEVLVSNGTINYNVTANASVGTGVVATIAPGATINAGGSFDPFSNGTNHVSVVNNSTASLNITAGSKNVGSITGVGKTAVTASGASLTANHVRQNELSVVTGGTVTVRNNGGPGLGTKAAGISVLADTTGDALSLANDAVLDLNNNDLIVYYAPGTGATTLANIQQMILDGFLGTTGVPVIKSSTGLVDMDKFQVAFDNGPLGIPSWEGQALTGSDQIIVKYTYFGDLNLDGQVDEFDYTIIDSNFGSGNSWITGDANLDGVVDAFDYTLIDSNFGKGVGNPLSIGGITAVPEPSTAMLALIGCVLGIGYYRRRSVA